MSTPTTLYTWPDGDTIAVKQGAMDPGYPDELTVLGPVFVPRVYGKDLTAFELGSSGKVVVTLDDLKTMELSNVYTGNQLSSTVIKGVASNAITLDPSDLANTVTAGGLVINDSNNFLALTTPNANGIAIRNALAVTGAVSLQSNLDVASNATIGGNASVTGNLSVTGNTNFNGGVDLTGDVSIVGKLTASNDLEVLGRAFLRSNLSVDGPATFSNVVSMDSNLSVASNVSVGSNLSVGGSATIQSGATINSGLTANGPIALTGPTSVVGDTSITGITSVTGPLSVSGAVALASNLDVASNVSVLGSTSLQAVSATSALINGPATVTGATTLQGVLSVSGATSLANTLAVTGAASFASNVSIAAGRILDVDNIKSVGNTLLLDAAEVVLTGDLNIAGSLNAINRTVLNVEDKRVTLASASNGLEDGPMTNDGAGVQVFGLPATVDPSESSNPVYEKSLAWRYGTSGVTALRTNRDAESYWDLRGGHLRLTSFKTANSAVSYGFRINERDELEFVRYVTDGSTITSKRIARFGGGVLAGAQLITYWLPMPFTIYALYTDNTFAKALQNDNLSAIVSSTFIGVAFNVFGDSYVHIANNFDGDITLDPATSPGDGQRVYFAEGVDPNSIASAFRIVQESGGYKIIVASRPNLYLSFNNNDEVILSSTPHLWTIAEF
jgi:hypothetical protein